MNERNPYLVIRNLPEVRDIDFISAIRGALGLTHEVVVLVLQGSSEEAIRITSDKGVGGYDVLVKEIIPKLKEKCSITTETPDESVWNIRSILIHSEHSYSALRNSRNKDRLYAYARG